jgi:hypothetical protein
MTARPILESSSQTLSLLIGNGINQSAGVTGGISWDALMETLVDEAADRAAKPAEARRKLRPLLSRNAQGQRPASLPEIFDVIEAVGTSAPSAADPAAKPPGLQARLAALFRDMRPGVLHAKVVAWAQRQQVPILTTNYDHCLQDAVAGLPCKQFRLKNGRAQSDYYPWDRYYG